MSLASGTRIGSYEVLSMVGAAGMGEVYRVRDVRLNRIVAIKILPETLRRAARQDVTVTAITRTDS
jgi:serine/threonine protein kinase